jgi:hypothetical protein
MLSLALACTPAAVDVEQQEDDSALPETAPAESAESVVHSGEAQETGSETGDTDEGDPCGEIAADEAAWASLFDSSIVHTFALSMTEEAMDALAASPGDYVQADVEVDGWPMLGVGLKMRGGAENMRWDAQPAFRIDLRRFGNCEPFASVDELVLDSGEDDPTQAREVISAQVGEALGLPVPRATFAFVDVNGTVLGLYTHVENVDAAFVAHHFDEVGGVLWAADDGADFTDAGVDAWDDVGGGGDAAALEAVASILRTATDDLYAQADTVVDMGQFLELWAFEAAIGHSEAYPYEAADIFAYAPPSDPRLRFVPWQLDEGWEPGFSWTAVEGALGVRCVYDETCRAAASAQLSSTLDVVDTLDVAGMAANAFALSADAVVADTRREATATEVQAARTALSTTISGWTDEIRAQLP